ncbi:pyridoxal-phosphate dependent enzyme [Streptomyces chitinivorans]|uniref:Pyridoxal-phosphate dependent enzyme n=1 Tax=Streptomyces chitinivorans TaxID=1257027 RepID=A0ABW7I177_9ACTN|nr:pyridoxal-phosphate dependent enzyme [Streptomyces chitinivorans]MDH2411586.1 pyridoxal-phosphate dependent enzyme [Streptomyces chitinivorans]
MPDSTPEHRHSLATGQRSLADPRVRYPLWPPLTEGCPVTSTDEVAYPLEVGYDYDRVPADLFDRPAAWVPVGKTGAYGIACPVGGYRGVLAVRGSGGEALAVTDEQMTAARFELASRGLWVELSAAAGLAGLRSRPAEDTGPVVCVATSSGSKDAATGTDGAGDCGPVPSDWVSVRAALRGRAG